MEGKTFTEEYKRELVLRYETCKTRDEKDHLAIELGLLTIQLYNLYSRWFRKYGPASL
jgi:hypothetical protein